MVIYGGLFRVRPLSAFAARPLSEIRLRSVDVTEEPQMQEFDTRPP